MKAWSTLTSSLTGPKYRAISQKDTKMNIDKKLVGQIAKFDDYTIETLLGTSIVKAVRSNYNTNQKNRLAEMIVLKNGQGILEDKSIRKNLLDTLTPREAVEGARLLGLPSNDGLEANKSLQKWISNSYNLEKSKQFIAMMGLPEELERVQIHDERQESEEVRVKFGETAKLKGYLHPYQKNVKDQILSKLRTPGDRLMVQMPTGAGKTFTALETAVDILRRPFQNQFVVWIVDSNELAEQALVSFRDLWKVKGDQPTTVFRLFKDFVPDFRAFSAGGVVFASYDIFHSILSDRHSERNKSIAHLVENTNYLLVDEAHSSVAETYQDCINAFIANDTTQIVGLTATPFRSDLATGKELQIMFTSNLVSIRDSQNKELADPIRFLQANEYLAELTVETLETDFSISSSNENQILQALAEDGDRNMKILEQIELAHKKEEKTLVFACTKDHVLALYIMCQAKSIGAKFITGDVPQSERIKILDNFRDGSVKVLINLDILSTGVDLPNINKLIITRPIRSPIQYSQIVGRALRGPKNGGNKKNTIVNIVDNIEYFSSISLLYSGFKQQWES